MHICEFSTVAADCYTETRIEMRGGTVERFPALFAAVRRLLPAANDEECLDVVVGEELEAILKK